MTAPSPAEASEEPDVATRPGDASPPVTVVPGSFVVMVVDGAEYGLPIASVREILHVPAITRVPFSADAVAGVVAIRGVVVPVLDLGVRLFSRPADRTGRLVVALPGDGAEPLALLVDAVVGVIDASDVVARDMPADAAAPLPAGWITALLEPGPGRMVTMLDIELVTRIEARAADEPALPNEHPEESG